MAAVTSLGKTFEVNNEGACWNKGNKIERNNKMELEKQREYNRMEQ